ncbi:winged helix-turn-helix domain-containing protein [Mycolicibacterium aubagnense]|uniref:DNA-binding response regulator n=1 Tax=Mycolicibacterium aubagnense TaxID=319707 RepID=A0ABM7IJF1_9MYCO|nr:response regulator transcription factor [Mycolicibacterium aubagnense]TLH66739.1 DNA-binding response regulator [Mycolicibacterium aubagnense]WGI31672.1 response regulator transcription factor [Mycolicibacterium aubagnense]BBX86848.1 DNA-binding response regulator [Mycolicibacterium aubagnense]
MRVLVCEDDIELGVRIAAGLRSAGFAVDVAHDLADADLKITVNHYDCLVMDRAMPDGDGLDLIAGKRAQGVTVPALMLTALDALADRVDGFAHGADDYLVKPFALAELSARVQALCRRRERPAPARINVGDLIVDLPRRRVLRDGILLTLTPKEFAVLETLAIRAGNVVSRTELVESCWDEMAEPASNVVDVVIAQLRRKLGSPSLIETVRGAGFLMPEQTPV